MEEDLKVIATSDPSKQMSLVTEAEVDPMEGEQTWPTEEELLQADGWWCWISCSVFIKLCILLKIAYFKQRSFNGSSAVITTYLFLEEAQKVNERKQKKVPKGTSEYQAAWIVDENDDDEEEEDDEDSDSEDMHEVADAEDEEVWNVSFLLNVICFMQIFVRTVGSHSNKIFCSHFRKVNMEMNMTQ